MWLLILGLVVFLGIHTIRMVAPEWREAKIQALGEKPWKGVYSLVSFAGLGLIIWGFTEARYETEYLYSGPAWLVHVTMTLMLISLILLAAREIPAGYIKSRVAHPMITGVIIWAIAHLLVNGDTASIILFGSLLVWSLWNRISAGRRDNPPVPFVSARYDVMAVVIAVIVWCVLVFWLHPILFGVEVIA